MSEDIKLFDCSYCNTKGMSPMKGMLCPNCKRKLGDLLPSAIVNTKETLTQSADPKNETIADIDPSSAIVNTKETLTQSMGLENATTTEIDSSVWSWAKKVYLFVLLLVGIPTAIIVLMVGFYTGEFQKELTKYEETVGTSQVCYKCGKPAIGYWYPYLRSNYKVFTCKEHFNSSDAEDEAKYGVEFPMMLFVIGCSVVFGIFMLLGCRPKFPKIISLSDSNESSGPPTWFWVTIISSFLFQLVAPVNLYVAWRARKAYSGLRNRIKLCWIAIGILIFLSVISLPLPIAFIYLIVDSIRNH